MRLQILSRLSVHSFDRVSKVLYFNSFTYSTATPVSAVHPCEVSILIPVFGTIISANRIHISTREGTLSLSLRSVLNNFSLVIIP